MAAVLRVGGRLAAENTAFFLCDMQEKFRPSIRYFPEIIVVAKRMVRVTIYVTSSRRVFVQVEAAKIMGIPVIATEQVTRNRLIK